MKHNEKDEINKIKNKNINFSLSNKIFTNFETWQITSIWSLHKENESATDRPTMSTVVFMLRNGNSADLPSPKQPAFIMNRTNNNKDQSRSEGDVSV